MSPLETVLAALRRLGCEPRQVGERQWSARCPSHNDHNPSFSLSVGDDGKVLVRCQRDRACSFPNIATSLGLTPQDFFPASPTTSARKRLLVETPYSIQDVRGAVQALHVRQDYSDGSKGFAWRGADGLSGLGGRKTASLPIYGSDRIAYIPAGSTVYLVEGEKARDALENADLTAFGTVTGANGTPDPGVLRLLLPFDVVCWPDNDAVGHAHMARCAAVLRDLGGQPRTLTWAEASDGEDAADFFARGGTHEQVEAMTAAAPFAVATPATGDGGWRADIVCLADVVPREVRHLWPTYVPLGKLTIIDGDPGCGKTWLAIMMGATLTRGGLFPGEDDTVLREPVSVVYVGAEDDPADTLRPRFEAAGADLSRVHVLRGRLDPEGRTIPLDLTDLDVIRQEMTRTGARLLVLDPVQAFLPATVDMHRANHVRPLLAALARLAEELDVAVVVIRHVRKAGAGRAIHAGIGSIDFAAAVRSLVLVGRDPEQEGVRVMAHAKCSTGPEGPSLAFEIRDGRFHWLGRTNVRAEDLCREPGPGHEGSIDDAQGFLRVELATGPVRVPEVIKAARAAGIAERTLKRAKKRLGVFSRKVGGEWWWELPPAENEGDARA